jgi:integrase
MTGSFNIFLIDVQVDISSKKLVLLSTEQRITAVSEKFENWKQLRLLLREDGNLVYPQNHYLHYLLKVKGNKNVNTAGYALLHFTRWLCQAKRSYRSVTENHRESPVWLFSNYLIDLIKRPSTQSSNISLSTARSYLLVVIDFYKFLHHDGILKIDETHKPFNFENRRIFLSNSSNHTLLSHTHRSTYIEIQTTDVMSRFPKVQQSSAHTRLTPISVKHQKIFFDHLKHENIRTQLMFKLAVFVGLRLSEVVSFPQDLPYSNKSKTEITIGPHNGVLTKFSKTRTVEIPQLLLTELLEYKHSEQRLKVKAKNAQRFSHEPLFLNQQGTILSTKTLQKLWSNFRAKIVEESPEWRYRFHDCRSTYATNYLISESSTRQLPYEFLITELAELMGHQSTTTTEKYIKFLDFKKHWLIHASLINKFTNAIYDEFDD